MIAQQELQKLLNLPDREKLQLAHRLIESLIAKTNGQQAAAANAGTAVDNSANLPDEPHPSVSWLMSMAGIYSGGPGDTGERADEICKAEIKKRSGFTLKEELPE